LIGPSRRGEFPALCKFMFSRQWRRRDDRPPISGRRTEIVKQNSASYEDAAQPDPANIVEARIKNLPGGKQSESS